MKAVIFILNDAALLQEVLRAWEDVGVRGVTVLNSIGLGRIKKAMYRDDAPLFPSLSEVLEKEQLSHRTLISVVDAKYVDNLIRATEKITGSLQQPNVGVLFTLAVDQVVGAYIGE